MTEEEELAIIEGWKAGNSLAGAALVRMHTGLVHIGVRRYVTARCELDDLLQVGRLAILHAARNHDASLGRLSTYAARMIQWEARTYAHKCRYVVSVSKNLCLADWERPTPVWLDAPLPSGDGTIVDRFAAPVDEAHGIDAAALIESLPPTEQNVMRRLYGPTPETLEQIGASMGVSKQAVWAAKKKAVARLVEAVIR